MMMRVVLAFIVAVVFDVADYYGAFVPWLGEAADAIPAMVNSVLLWNPLPLVGLIEGASAFPPLLVLDFLPFHLAIFLYTVYRMKKQEEVTRSH